MLPRSSTRHEIQQQPPPGRVTSPKPNNAGEDGPGNESPDTSGSSLHLQVIDPKQVPDSPTVQHGLSDSTWGETVTGRYHDALDALVSLRTEETPMVLGLPSDNLFHVPDSGDDEQDLEDLILTSKTPTCSLALDGLSEEDVLALLKHWRYEVAPWVGTP